MTSVHIKRKKRDFRYLFQVALFIYNTFYIKKSKPLETGWFEKSGLHMGSNQELQCRKRRNHNTIIPLFLRNPENTYNSTVNFKDLLKIVSPKMFPSNETCARYSRFVDFRQIYFTFVHSSHPSFIFQLKPVVNNILRRSKVSARTQGIPAVTTL